MKTCTRCGETKDIADYYARSGRCKPCHKAAGKEWRHADPDAYNAYARAYTARNKERMAENRKRRWEADPERHRAYGRKWNKANPDKVMGWVYRRRALLAGAHHEPYTRTEIYVRDNGTCQICGEHVPADGFHIDHIIPLAAGGPDTPDNVQTACPPCNLRKWAKTA